MIVHAASGPQNCLVVNDWVCPLYLQTRAEPLLAAVREHLYLTVVSVVLGAVLALPLAVLAHRVRRARALTLGVTTVLYTVPSIALFFLVVPMLGLSAATVITGLTLYTLTILVRNLLVGLDGVDAEVLDAARGMGLSPGRMLWRVELPLALPAAMAGLRVAAVSTVALTTVGAIIGYGGLGTVLVRGLSANFHAEVLTAAVLCVLLALVLDVVLLLAQRAVTPWRRTA
ncbi:MAG: ABC transporter, permease protein (cluster 13, osmolytes) [uncultured Quadrisphaera sp.]|uniref:ABC transporter, permease protein (Cluster 13, osmolytes) n=1 Tax=uncultured Quadrisphaera sp. TaxID=904978 RepID=A0A6J4NY52_9ACTN|nr:MAG: ABC transporter, permease protein (cluster 13, osmolytes) [uncultured Quadrisphaera sp.]